MRSLIKSAVAVAAAALPMMATATPANAEVFVFDANWDYIGNLINGGSEGVTTHYVGSALYQINFNIKYGFLGYTFYYQTTDCSGQPWVSNANWTAMPPAQYYNGPAANGQTGWIYGPDLTSAGQLAEEDSVTVYSEAYNWGTLSRYCSLLNGSNGAQITGTPVYPLAAINDYPPFVVWANN